MRIATRDAFVSAVEALPRYTGKTKLYKLDRFEQTGAGVYLGRMESEITSQGQSQCAERSLIVIIDLFVIGDSQNDDADAMLDTDLTALEAAVMAAARAKTIPRATQLTLAEFLPTDTSNERAGLLTTRWQCDYDELI